MSASARDSQRGVMAAPAGQAAARAACAVGLAYAAISVYWGTGGTWLLSTVVGAQQVQGVSGSAAAIIVVWTAAVLKLTAAVLPLLAIREAAVAAAVPAVATAPAVAAAPAVRWLRWLRLAWVLAWIEASILTLYGLVLTVPELLEQASVITIPAHADRRALAWHAYLWDPWFLIWGLLVTAALLQARSRRRPQVTAAG